MISIKASMLPILILFLVSCGAESNDNWVRPYFDQHRVEFLQVKSFIDSCNGFSYANGLGSYLSGDAPGCKNGVRPAAVTPQLKEMGVYWVINDLVRHNGIQFVTKSPGIFGAYGAINYDVAPKTAVEIRARDGTPLEQVCPCHWYYVPS